MVHGTSEVDAGGIDIILAVDVSGSMEALDFTIDNEPANRVDVVKKVVSRFIDERPNDRIGLVAFAGRPYMVSPLTLDHQWLQKRLNTIHPGMVEDGTAIAFRPWLRHQSPEGSEIQIQNRHSAHRRHE